MTNESQINWTVSALDFAVIVQIAERAVALAQRFREPYPQRLAVMDLQACHANGCPLDLEGLLTAQDGDFGHDVFGIRRYLDRETGKLQECFTPRFRSTQEAK
jgi:hypothetical protein